KASKHSGNGSSSCGNAAAGDPSRVHPGTHCRTYAPNRESWIGRREVVAASAGELSGRPVRRVRRGPESPVLARVPFQLAHFPGLLAGLVAGAALLALATASGGLFLSSAASSAASSELRSLDAPALTISTYGSLTEDFEHATTGVLARSLARIPDLAP